MRSCLAVVSDLWHGIGALEIQLEIALNRRDALLQMPRGCIDVQLDQPRTVGGAGCVGVNTGRVGPATGVKHCGSLARGQ